MHILPLLSLLPLALAIQGTEFDICVASRSSGLSDISGVQRRFGTDWTKDNWTVQVAPTTHSQAVKPKDSDIVIRTTNYISEEGPVNLTYSCLQNVPTGSYAKLTKVMQIPKEQVSAVDDGVVAVDYYVHNPFFMADGAIVEDDGFLDNLAETASVPLGYEFVNLTFVDAKGGVVAWFLDDNGGGNYSTAKGVSSRYIYVPEGTRSIKAEIYGSVGSPQDTLPSSFCIGRYSVFTCKLYFVLVVGSLTV
ncbi:hypothetical protein BCR33DRAFT_505436 [Rhizoclosmatium globosum]|uniref:Uncharacterized protein n=1 Tax=Rhizoclosmatium globosum TaxID=329046 RepID=A0A1Y2BM38_9FUNG|nr:hypothetical protein BCR33DRAFT_505436 [Rhizoclosmatium globosum]|eukprot:ORY35225.1 hypothetical protein BCR33DRAFT_505436 [Rhizoclosmatium globosum]